MDQVRVSARHHMDTLKVQVDVVYLKLKYKLEAIAMEAKCEVGNLMMKEGK